jgi:predicted AAA+ superfamily ATPase
MERYLSSEILTLALKRHKMAFVSGPRQVGKTTLAKTFIEKYDKGLYKNWDDSDFRKIWTKSPNSLQTHFQIEKTNQSRLLILDEIHKSKNWKQKLKGFYDTLGSDIDIIVTGSARLNVFKKGGDSMMGRYLNFRMHPLSYGEVSGHEALEPDLWKTRLLKKPTGSNNEEKLNQLIALSGFPEPFFSGSEKILKLWRQGRTEKIIREDLRDLSRIMDLSQIEALVSMLPERVGSPLSIQAIREDLEVSFDSVKRWLGYLNELYYYFELKPWSKSIPRSLKKEGKIYLYDWTEISDSGARFENLIACHLQKACHYWNDTGNGYFDLFYLRNKEKQEIDFILIRDKKPWLMIEAKLSESQVEKQKVAKYQSYFKCPYVQVVRDPGLWFLREETLVTSATHLLTNLA